MRDDDLDKLFRSAMDDLEGIPPQVSNWDVDKTFGKIQEQLNPKNTRKFPGIFDLAAAVVITIITIGYATNYLVEEKIIDGDEIAAIIDFSSEEAVEEINSTLETENPDENNFILSKMENQEKAFPEIDLKSVDFQYASTSLANNIPPVATRKNRAISKNNNAGDQKNFDFVFNSPMAGFSKKGNTHDGQETLGFGMDNTQTPNQISLSFPIGFSYMADHFAPTISGRVALNKQSKKNVDKISSIAATISSYHFMDKNESGKMSVDSRFFVEASFGKFSSDHDKVISGHEIGGGYMLGKDNEQFKGKTFKVNYSISVKNKIKVSPEAIITDNFSKVYPGIKVTLI
ncbi:hypothetical protein [Flexithrix dorotheae]|uniref:hypothetical protein n=1 Tax=Flexithrix dorotheae TaxID=70993 RepID=UPI000377848D|nr:hypothetical protein [Flexithrix dorotheae]